MINPQDLRIGNLIWHTVNNIDTAAMEDVLTTVDGNLIKSLELHPHLGYNPIPLTEEWLMNFKFIKDNYGVFEKTKDNTNTSKSI